jgi:biotin synthase
LNATPCPKNCKFCSFAICNDLRHGKSELPIEEVVECAKIYQEEGVNAMLLLATASYKFEKVVEVAQAVREVIDPSMPLLTNTEDLTLEQAKRLKAVGVDGAYHAVRMREGIDTGIPVEDRLQTFDNLRQAGMSISTCVEPVGPENTPEELTAASRICMESGANSAGVGRRVTVLGTLVESRGMISDLQNAMNVAVYRLAAGTKPMLNCAMATALSASAGANLAWAEVGTNPRDVKERTQNGGRGTNVEFNRKMFQAAGYEILEGPSQGWRL